MPGSNGHIPQTGERPLSLSYYTVAELGAVEAVETAAATGCSQTGLRLLGGQPGGGETPLLASAALRRELAAAMARHGITALDANTVRLVPDTEIDAYLPFFDAAAELGARHVLTTVDDAERERVVDRLTRLCEIAAERGLTIDLEFVPWQALSSIERAADLLRLCNHPVLGIAVDALHYFRSHAEPAQIERLPAGWFRYAQVCDVGSPATPASLDAWIEEATRERLPPGEGVIDLPGMLRALPPAIPLALEIPQAALARSVDAKTRVAHSVAAIRRILEKIDEA